jgi:hypothetical protein
MLSKSEEDQIEKPREDVSIFKFEIELLGSDPSFLPQPHAPQLMSQPAVA